MEKGSLIRKRDVIFWEHEFGYSSTALPHRVSIYGGKLIPHFDHREDVPQLTEPPTTLPLSPVPAGQSISKLPPETKSNEITFIPYVPPPAASRNRTLQPHVAKFVRDHRTIGKGLG